MPMKRSYKNLMYFVIPIIIFLFALFLRIYFFTGFILGDDLEEFQAFQHIMTHGPILNVALHIRFGLWFFHVLSFKLLGVSIFSFFLPTLLMSSTFGIIGYFLLTFWKYPRYQAFLAALFIASAPFEILIGVIHANDLIFSWILALALFSFIIFEKRPIIQGILVAFLLWFAFYIKIWVVYLFPVLALYYLYQFVKYRIWKGFASFFITSLFLHEITCIVWKFTSGTFIPFIYYTSATYSVAKETIPWLLQFYPKMIIYGSEFGTTLFGIIPYLLFALLIIKAILSAPKFRKTKFDKFDVYLFAFYTSFFLLLNYFPTTFKFDQYYSAPRIFRYLAPLSFPMTLHVAKLILDLSKIKISFKSIGRLRKSIIGKYPLVFLFAFLICVNIYQADNATKPGQIYNTALLSIVKDVKEQSPPQLLVENWLSFFLREVYLKDTNTSIISPNYTIDDAKKYEQWLQENQHNLTEGSMMISGIGSYVQYGCHNCGFRLRQFNGSLDPGWKLFKEYQNQSYLPIPEPARLWVWLPSAK
jgi:hypothetical protein